MDSNIELSNELHFTFISQIESFIQRVHKTINEEDIEILQFDEYVKEFQELANDIKKIKQYEKLWDYTKISTNYDIPGYFPLLINISGECRGINIMLKKPINETFKKNRKQIMWEWHLNKVVENLEYIVGELKAMAIEY
jgi:hypothetical protein